MPNQTIQNAIDAIEKAKGAEASATLLIGAFAGRIQDAVNAALEAGASAEQLAPVQAEVDALNASADALAAAVAANS